MQKIKEYLEAEEKDFDQGLELLKAHCQNTALLHRLKVRKPQAELENELQKVLDNAEEEKPFVVSVKPPQKATPTKEKAIKPLATVKTEEELAEEKAEMAKQLDALHVKRCQLSNQLADIAEGAELEEKVKEVLAAKEEYRALFAQYKAFDEIAVEVEETEAEVKYKASEDPKIALLKIEAELKPLREKISKTNKKLAESPTHAKAAEWQTELAQAEAAKEELEQKKKLILSENE